MRSTESLVEADKRYLWHPFTPMRQWCEPSHEPVVLCRGEGAWLWDTRGRRYLDGNSSIWTNIHGHSHPRLLAALRRQSEVLCHSSFLGATNPPAIELAEALIDRVQPGPLKRVFYSDNGSTAIEVAIKMTCQYFQMTGHPERRLFISFNQAYHGDTMGASSVGGVPLFFSRYADYQFPSRQVKNWEELRDMSSDQAAGVAAVVIEPILQGVAGMRPWPPGMLRELRAWCDRHGALLIFDEVLTGFGRTGTLFACQREGVWPDFLALAKGLTGGLMPLAATLVTDRLYEAFLGELEERKTFYYGHSYTGNPLACTVALESLRIMDDESTLTRVNKRAETLQILLKNNLFHNPYVIEIRQVGLICGIEIGPPERHTLGPENAQRLGARITALTREAGVMTRNILNVLTFLPPLCITEDDLSFAIPRFSQAINQGAQEIFG